MEQKERNTGIWKRFFLDHLFLLLMGVIALIVFIIISFVIEDRVYLFLSIGVLCTVLLWTGIEAIVCYVKNKEPKEKEIC